MIESKIRDSVADRILPQSEIISAKLKGDAYINELIAKTLLEENSKGGLTDEQYDSFITPYLNQWSSEILPDEEWDQVRNTITEMINQEESEDVKAYLRKKLTRLENKQNALKAYKDRMARRSMSVEELF